MTILAEPTPKRWTKSEYHGLMDWFGEDRMRYELIDGEIIQMPPQKDEHSYALSLAEYAVREIFSAGFVVKTQSPLNLSAKTEPEPDLMVIKGELRDMRKHPKHAELIIEVAGASLEYDRQTKGSLYASKGIRDYWIVNLRESVIEVRRKPQRDPAAKFGYSYGEIQILRRSDVIAPLAAPKAKIKASRLLP